MKTPAFISPKPYSLLFVKLSNPKLLDKNKRQNIQCQIRSFENQPKNWSIEFMSGPEHIHLIQNSTASASMAATSVAELAARSATKVFLFYCPETKALAERVAAESDVIELRSINWRTFEDGFPNLFIPNAHGVPGQHVAFLASFSTPGRGRCATAFTLARILSNIPTSRGGSTSLVTFDIHALLERFYFGDNILPYFESGIPLLKNRLQQLPDSDNISIAFPDDGAWKQFHKQLQHFPMKATCCIICTVDRQIVCNKVREGDQRIVHIKEGDPRG